VAGSMHLFKVALLVVADGRLLRTQPQVLSATQAEALDSTVLGGLISALKNGTGECASYLDGTLKALERAYTKVQVPFVLHQVCNQGTFFHAFEDAAQCSGTTDKLVAQYEGKADYKGWCTDLKELLGDGAESAACKCVGIPDSIEREGEFVLAASGDKYPASYGGECKTHDLELAGCAGEYKPAYCFESWCYVDKACAATDRKASFFFGKQAELYYSYQTCGSVDAYAAEACAGQDEGSCAGFSENCAWNKPSGNCQNRLCQCTGTNKDLDEAKLGFREGYGESCQAWDAQTCEEWKEKGDGFQLGLWCCKDWCYVDEGCPSAERSSAADGLFYSYLACPDDAAELAACPWEEPVDFGGEPLALSSDAAAALNKE
jgi:hypothetical protein